MKLSSMTIAAKPAQLLVAFDLGDPHIGDVEHVKFLGGRCGFPDEVRGRTVNGYEGKGSGRALMSLRNIIGDLPGIDD